MHRLDILDSVVAVVESAYSCNQITHKHSRGDFATEFGDIIGRALHNDRSGTVPD